MAVRFTLRRLRWRLLIWPALYLCLALVVTRAWHTSPGSVIPTASDGMTTVPLFNAWTIWWNADRLLHGFQGYWTAPIFHPEPYTFAFSEPQPATLMVAPVIWAGGSRALAYNVYLQLSLVLNGLVTAILLSSLGRRMLVATLGGAAMLLLPILYLQMEVLQLMPVWGILWTWHAIRKLDAAPGWRRGLETGVAFAASFAMSIHHGLFMTLLLGGTAWIFLARRDFLPRLKAGLIAVAVGATFTLPLVYGVFQGMRTNDFDRAPRVVQGLSTRFRDYLAPPPNALLPWGVSPRLSTYRFSPGWLKTGLALVGLVLTLVRFRRLRWTVFLTLTAVLAILLSMGPHLCLGSWRPWWTLVAWCPGFAQVRNAFRFAYFAQMAVILLSMEGLHLLLLWQRRFFRTGRRGVALKSAIVVLGIAATFEAVPSPPLMVGVPDAERQRGWIDFVRRETPEGAGIACIPFAPAQRAVEFDMTARWMYYGTYHGVPLVNGYSGWFPQSYWRVHAAVNAGFPNAAALNRLAEHDVEFVVALRSHLPRREQTGFPSVGLQLRLVFEDPVGVDVYRLEEMKEDL